MFSIPLHMAPWSCGEWPLSWAVSGHLHLISFLYGLQGFQSSHPQGFGRGQVSSPPVSSAAFLWKGRHLQVRHGTPILASPWLRPGTFFMFVRIWFKRGFCIKMTKANLFPSLLLSNSQTRRQDQYKYRQKIEFRHISIRKFTEAIGCKKQTFRLF